jgi:hypothetical protein
MVVAGEEEYMRMADDAESARTTAFITLLVHRHQRSDMLRRKAPIRSPCAGLSLARHKSSLLEQAK